MASDPKSTLEVYWPPKHRYAREAEELVRRFKEIVAEPATSSGWTQINSHKDVIVSRKESSVPLGLLRGDGLIKGYVPLEVFPVTALPNCRKIWDELFEEGRPVESLDPCTTLSYAGTKGQFPVAGRDFSVVLVTDIHKDGRIFSMSVSVKDDKVPDVRGKVRAQLKLNGWYLEPLKDEIGTRVVYLSEVDLNGWIPDAILKIVAQKMPMVVADVRKYVMKHGPPPFFSSIGGTPAATPKFDHNTHEFELKVNVNNKLMKETTLLISPQRYASGAQVIITPGDIVRVEVAADNKSIVLHHEEDAHNGAQLSVKIQPTASEGKIVVTLGAGDVVPSSAPLPSASSSSSSSAAPIVPSTSAPATTTIAADVIDPFVALPLQIARIEKAVALLHKQGASSHYSVTSQRLGLAFLAAVPIISIIIARVF